MLPQGLFGISPFLLVIPLVGWVGFYVFLRGARGEGVPIRRVMVLQAAASVVALLGARAFSLVFELGWNPLDPHSREAAGGWRYSGGLLGFLLAVAVLRPRLVPELSLARYGDLVAPAAALAVGVFRIHCILQGCCVGATCNGALCFSYHAGSEVWLRQVAEGLPAGTEWSAPVLALHLLFMVASLAAGAFLLWFDSRRQYNGQVFLLFLLLHDGPKAALELLRDPASQLLQLASLIPAFIALGALSYLWLRGRAPREAASP